jgi:26S proteasome non-ATPase regulatory subunit 10
LVRLLLAAGAPVDKPDKAGNTPLAVAAAAGAPGPALVLAGAGAAVDAANKEGATPLSLAPELAPQLRAVAAGDLDAGELVPEAGE